MLNRFQVSKWHLSRQHFFMWHLSISGIYQLLLIWFWPDFESRFLGPSKLLLTQFDETFWTSDFEGLGSKFWLKKNIGHKNYESKNFQVKKILLQKIVSKNFGKNGVSNSWYIPDMDKCCQDKCCLDKCHHHVSWNLFKRVPGTYL